MGGLGMVYDYRISSVLQVVWLIEVCGFLVEVKRSEGLFALQVVRHAGSLCRGVPCRDLGLLNLCLRG